jgi:uncharacterized protein YdeI (YjbR/CyaY-like superfamily)
MRSDKNTFTFTDRKDWRSWLDNNHSDVSEAWIVIQKKHSPVPGLFLDEAVEEALCFGWIDSTLNTRDDQSYFLRFSPRKPNSVWSMSNINRVEMLINEGLMKNAGLAAVQAAKENGEWQAAIDREDPEYVPPDLEVIFKQDPEALEVFRKLPASKKKRHIYWLQSAKQEKTRQKRLLELLRLMRD